MTTQTWGAGEDPTPPLVSVLIRSMDRETLAEALASVAAQTYDAIEVVVVNAGAQPHRPLGERCGRFALRLVEPGGSGLARASAANRAMSEAPGEWLLFLDDDDLIDPNHIARLRQALAESSDDAQVAYAGVRIIGANTELDEPGRPAEPKAVLDEPFDADRLWLANYLPIHAVMFARRLFDKGARFDEALPVYEDWDFWQRLAREHRFLHVPGVSATYRLIGDSGLSADRDEAYAHAAREAVYRQWLPQMTAGQLERLATGAERARSGLLSAQAELAAAGSELDRLGGWTEHLRADIGRLSTDLNARQADLHRAEARTAELTQLHAASIRAERALKLQFDESIAYQHHLLKDIAAAQQAYQQLADGYRNITESFSWRVTAPLRSLRAKLAKAALRRSLRAATRRLVLALPVSPATRQRAKVWLAASGWGAPLLRWLAPLPPQTQGQEPASGTTVPVLDKGAIRAEAEDALSAFLQGGQRLHFPPLAASPRVSVITVLFNQAGLSLLCLQALAQSRSVQFETLVVDNASSDRVPQMLQCIDGVQVLTQSGNLGFLRAVNLAAGHARGEYLLLLNNDAVVEPDTLAHAVARLDADPRIGAVGGPILLWDGRLQEAGSIVWRDGSCLGYGRGDTPDAGPYRFLRDVDYCSGAFLMLRRELFESMGRFDDAYAPAYYEESDFCVRLWEAGRPVVFDPKVRVKHFEFASDTSSGRALELQARNRVTFAEKHLHFLAERPTPDLAHVLAARQRLQPGARKVLFIDDRVPMPWLGQGYPRAARFVAAIAARGDFVTHYPLQFPHESWDEVYRALPETVEVMLDQGLAGIAGFLSSRAGFYDVLVVSRPHNMDVISALRSRHPEWFNGLRIVYDAEALFSVRDIAKAEVLGQPIPAAEQQQLIQGELALARGADCIVAVSEAEARHYREAGFGAVHVLGHALALHDSSDSGQQRRGFLFVGAVPFDDSPNGDSLLWFIREVWPLIVAELGDAALLDIVGPNESATIRGLATEAIRIHGQVPAVEPFYDAARVFLVPTRYAAGIPHKAHEAAASGLPMVVTPLIAQQLHWTQEVLVAATPADYAAACVRLHRNEALWQEQRRKLLAAVQRDCSPAAFELAVDRIMGRTQLEHITLAAA